MSCGIERTFAVLEKSENRAALDHLARFSQHPETRSEASAAFGRLGPDRAGEA